MKITSSQIAGLVTALIVLYFIYPSGEKKGVAVNLGECLRYAIPTTYKHRNEIRRGYKVEPFLLVDSEGKQFELSFEIRGLIEAKIESKEEIKVSNRDKIILHIENGDEIVIDAISAKNNSYFFSFREFDGVGRKNKDYEKLKNDKIKSIKIQQDLGALNFDLEKKDREILIKCFNCFPKLDRAF